LVEFTTQPPACVRLNSAYSKIGSDWVIIDPMPMTLSNRFDTPPLSVGSTQRVAIELPMGTWKLRFVVVEPRRGVAGLWER
jgi:hypothetical protein